MNMQTGQLPTPRNGAPSPLPAKEQLQALAEQSQTALENTMLKQTLTEYLEQFAVLKAQQSDFLLQAERRYRQDKRTMDAALREMVLSNKALTDSIERETEKLKDSLLQSATKSVAAGLAQNIAAFDKAISNIEGKEVAAIKRMGKHLRDFDEQARRLFEFDTIKHWIFWGGCVSNVLVLILLLCVRRPLEKPAKTQAVDNPNIVHAFCCTKKKSALI